VPRFVIRFAQHGMHTHMRVFVGAEGQRALAGNLVMRFDEADAFFAAMQAGSVGPTGAGAEIEIAVEPRAEEVLGG
jgi:hypothetical protein